MIRKLLLIGLAFLAARMARRALRREAEVISLLWTLIQVTAGGLSVPPASSNTAKTRGLEDRVNNIIPFLINPQPTPGSASDGTSAAGNNSYGPSNNSSQSGNNAYQGNGINVTWNPQSSGNDGGDNSSTSGQIGGASAHTHSMTHTHASSTTLDSQFNTLVTSHGTLCAAFNNHITDYGALVTTVGALRTDHSNLITTVNTIQSSHAGLVSAHNTLITKLNNANVLQ